MEKNVVKVFFKPYDEGLCVATVTGRSLLDYEIQPDGKIEALLDEIHRGAMNRDMVVIQYSMAQGIGFKEDFYSESDRKKIDEIINTRLVSKNCGAGGCSTSNEILYLIRGWMSLCLSPKYENLKFEDGRKMKFCLIIQFASDALPNEQTTLGQLVAGELAYISAYSRLMAERGNYLVFSDIVDKKLDGKIMSSTPDVKLPYPDYQEKLRVVEGLKKAYPNALLDNDLTEHQVANIASGTPNMGICQLYKLSHNKGISITAKELIAKKQADVLSLSEGTLQLLDTDRIKNVELKGVNIERPAYYVTQWAYGLRQNDPLTPSNILLLGAPSTGKTDLALRVALLAGVPAFKLLSPKGGIVGETERKARVQMETLRRLSPSIGFIDEITEAYPMSRQETNLDSGASAAVTANLLEHLSDKSRDGRSMIVATSNCGWRLGTAMLSRFLVVPVLSPVLSDYPQIIYSIAKSLDPKTKLDINDANVVSAATIFYEKNLPPRNIRQSLKWALSELKTLSPNVILWAAEYATPLDHASRLSAQYSDLYAIHLSSSKLLLPWYRETDPQTHAFEIDKNYPFPDYIRDILDDNYEVDPKKLHAKLEELKPYVNV